MAVNRQMKKPDQNDRFEFTELFMAQASRDRRFYGTIKRLKDENDIPYVFGEIAVNNGFIYARAIDQLELGDRLDEMVLLILNHNIQPKAGNAEIIAGTPYFLN